jgi:N-acetyl-anhydromuramyl-L-alanine amidase AmpD
MVKATKEFSANCTVSNEGRVTGVVDEEDRAWTSGSTTDGGAGAAWDRRSITLEIENEMAGSAWPVSASAHEAVAREFSAGSPFNPWRHGSATPAR